MGSVIPTRVGWGGDDNIQVIRSKTDLRILKTKGCSKFKDNTLKYLRHLIAGTTETESAGTTKSQSAGTTEALPPFISLD